MRALGMPGFTDAGVSSAPLERQRYRGNRGPQVACNPSVHMSCLVMAPIETRPRASRRLSGAGLGIDTESEIRVYDILDADADSNGPGSTWGRTH